MSYRKQVPTQQRVSQKHAKNQNGFITPQQQPAVAPNMQRAIQQIAAGKYQRALELLTPAQRDDRTRNTRGVCLIRLGRIEDAIRLFRELVLQGGCTWTRPDLPTVYKTNFATALLLGGHSDGCMDILRDLKDENHPSVLRLQAAVKQWTKTLSWWQRLNWWLGKIAPSNRPVTLDFPPGDFDFELTLPERTQPLDPNPSNRTAA